MKKLVGLSILVFMSFQIYAQKEINIIVDTNMIVQKIYINNEVVFKKNKNITSYAYLMSTDTVNLFDKNLKFLLDQPKGIRKEVILVKKQKN